MPRASKNEEWRQPAPSAYDTEANEPAPMTLGNMREHGVSAVWATCEACEHEALVSVAEMRDDFPVPDVALRLRCGRCGSREVKTIPDWRGATGRP